jgi:hypothetical protein
MPANELAKHTNSAYHGLTTSIRAKINPVAGYQVTNPSFDSRIISGRLRTRKTTTNDTDRIV